MGHTAHAVPKFLPRCPSIRDWRACTAESPRSRVGCPTKVAAGQAYVVTVPLPRGSRDVVGSPGDCCSPLEACSGRCTSSSQRLSFASYRHTVKPVAAEKTCCRAHTGQIIFITQRLIVVIRRAMPSATSSSTTSTWRISHRGWTAHMGCHPLSAVQELTP